MAGAAGMAPRRRPAPVRVRVLLVVIVAVALNGSWAFSSGASVKRRLLVGAYYYLWYPQNLAQGTLRADLVPSQAPSASSLDSNKEANAVRDIRQAHRAGIDFFAVDWWPHIAGLSGRDYASADKAMGAFLSASNISEIKFCMFYETWNLGFDPGRESTPVTTEMERRFDTDMEYFARRYFSNTSYLRIKGRPVVFLYLTRTLTGDVAGMIQGARSKLEKMGVDPYFVGDEVYWRVTPELPLPDSAILTTQPQVARIEQFDAITAYTLYYGDPETSLGPTADFIGYPGTTNVVRDELALLREYRDATHGRVPVIPDISPGFNDRGVRLSTNHPAQPRQWLPGDGPASTLDAMFRDVAVPSLDATLPMVMVTAWNEWNEDTGVEPIAGTATSRDDSLSGTAYTQGYTYGGEGHSDVDTLRRDIAAADDARAG